MSLETECYDRPSPLDLHWQIFQQLADILKDDEASSNDKFVALELLKNANIAAGMVLPGCQDTGTAICMGRASVKGHHAGWRVNVEGEGSTYRMKGHHTG